MTATITPISPDSAEAQALIAELTAETAALYPPENRYGYSAERLLKESVAFFLIRENGIPAGCAGVKLVGSEYAEVKRMYVRPQFRGLGLAQMMLDHLAGYARSHGIEILRLETGIYQHAAIRLYERVGFQPIPPFGEYKASKLNRFYEKRLDGWPSGG